MSLIKGQLEQAQLENVSADPSNLPNGRVWYNYTSSQVRAAIGGVAKILVTEDGAHTLTNKTIDVNGTGNAITNIQDSNISASAGIAHSKMAPLDPNVVAVTNGSGAVSASSTTATELGYLNGVTSGIQGQLDNKEPTITTLTIAKGGTNSGAALSNNRAMISSGGAIVEATTTSTEIGYVNGVTSAIQTQLNAKAPVATPAFTGGTASIAGSSSGVVTVQTQAAAGTYNFNLPTSAGSPGEVLTSAGGSGSPMTWSSVLTNPMTTAGDVIYSSDGSGTPASLSIGSSDGMRMKVASGLPSWGYGMYAAKTGAYTLVAADDVIRCSTSGGAFTVTLLSAVGLTGKVFTITLAVAGNVLTIATTSSQTINGAAASQFKMATVGDNLTVVSDGSNWQIVTCSISSIYSVHHTAGKTLAATTVNANFTFNTTGNDTLSQGSGTNAIFTAVRPGTYHADFAVGAIFSAANTGFYIDLFITGPSTAQSSWGRFTSASDGTSGSRIQTCLVSKTVRLAASNTLTVSTTGTYSAGSLTTHGDGRMNYFNVTRVGD